MIIFILKYFDMKTSRKKYQTPNVTANIEK